MKYVITIPQVAKAKINKIFGADKIIYECLVDNTRHNRYIPVKAFDLDKQEYNDTIKLPKYLTQSNYTPTVYYKGCIQDRIYDTFDEAVFWKAYYLKEVQKLIQEEIDSLTLKQDLLDEDLEFDLTHYIDKFPEFLV